MNMRIDSVDAMDNLKAGLEISQAELKKQSDQAKRFGNVALKNHPQLGNVKGALKVLQPEQLLKVLQNTRSAMDGQGGTTRIVQQDMPQLAAPHNRDPEAETNNDETRLNTSARMTLLLGKMTQLTSDSSFQNLSSQLQNFNAMMKSAGSACSTLATALEVQGTKWANDNDALKDAQNQASKLEQDVNKAQSERDSAQKKLVDLEGRAADKPLVSSERQQQIDDAKKAVAVAQGNVNSATSTYNNYVSKTLNPAINAEGTSRSALESTQAKSQTLLVSLTPQQQSVIETHRKQSDQEAKSLTFLLALMAQLINQSSSDDLKASAGLKQKLSEAAAKDAEKKAREYEEEVRKAEELQKTMGCVGKVLGWVITAVSFAAAAFTGGASLALAAVGLALAIGDEINQAVNGNSFMADAMQPMMDAIVKPLMEFMGKMFATILESYGVDKETAAMVGQIMGAIAAAAVLVAGVIVAGSVMSKVFGVVIKKMGSNVAEEAGKTMANKVATRTTMQRLMDSAVGQVFKRINQGFGRLPGMSEVKMAQVSTRSRMALTGASMVNTSIQVAGNIIVADRMVEAAKAKAQMLKDAALQELLNEMMSRAVDTFSHRMETVNSIIKNISSVAENQMQAGKYITRQMSTVAG